MGAGVLLAAFGYNVAHVPASHEGAIVWMEERSDYSDPARVAVVTCQLHARRGRILLA